MEFMSRPSKPPKEKREHSPLRILPLSADQVRTPNEFNYWLFANSPIIMQGLFDRLDDASPNERIKVLQELFRTCLDARPFSPNTSDSGKDTAKTLAELLQESAKRYEAEDIEDEHLEEYKRSKGDKW
jgi:hypothetical protein